jgi:hemerythrin-like metal-binding protein
MTVRHWLQRYDTGNPAIDVMHEDALTRLDVAYDAIINQRPAREQAGLIASALEGFQAHFAVEERDLAETDHPDAEAHQASHRDFLARLEVIHASAKQGTAVTTQALELINGYMTEHVKQHDAKLAAALNAKAAAR